MAARRPATSLADPTASLNVDPAYGARTPGEDDALEMAVWSTNGAPLELGLS